MALSRLIRVGVAAALFIGSVVSTNVATSASDPLELSRPIAAGAAHTLAIDPSGTVWSWGQNLVGQLGTGDHQTRLIPTQVSGLTGVFVAVSAGLGHSLALRNDGEVFAFGLNLEGQLGIGNNVTKVTPVHVTALSNVVAIAAGGGHSLAVKADGSIWAWGGNLLGQVGDGSATQRRVPVRVTTLSNITAVEAGATHSLALKSDGSLWSWGGNTSGQLGIGSLTLKRRPTAVLNVSVAKGIAAGAFHSLAVTESGALWGWGLNIAGAVGDGSTTTRKTPVLISGVPAIAAVSAGGAHSVAITTSSSALGWGDNTAGQIGDGSTTRRLSPVTVVQPPSTITAIAAGGAHTIALASDSAVWTWGNNLLAQLGDGTHTPRPQPSPISGPNAMWGVHPPLFTPGGGTFSDEVSVSLSTPTPDAVINYTLDGTEPTESHSAFVSPIPIASTTTVKAKAFRSGLTPSLVSVATYTIGGGTLATPVATPAGGTYAQPQSVTLTADAGADIRYTLDGSEPSPSSSLFDGPITIASTTTLRARAFKAGFTPSEILTANYAIETTVPPGENPPPDPVSVAPPVSDVLLTSFADANAFLFAGADPIQRNHTPESIAVERMAIIRGQVRDRDGAPLEGVRVTPRDQSGVGHTVTRADGLYDVAVNGGGPVMLEYTRNGFLPAQRSVDAPWQDFASAPDVRLVRLDSVVTPVSFEPQTISVTARGSVSTDDNGSRQATIIVPETGVMAIIHLHDGTMMPGVSQLSIRATEYTVGTGGPQAMPAPLPATSGYTYAVELTADEAIQAGATNVTFDPPLAFYVENFRAFPIGGVAPVGYFDRTRSAWIPSDDGRVIGVLGVNAAGEAELDVDGDGEANPAVDEVVCEPDGDGGEHCEPVEGESLADLGITSGERKRLALLYAPGQSLWRAPIPHFSTFDINWPFGAPGGAEAPQLEPDNDGSTAPGTRSTQRTDRRADGQLAMPTCAEGSVIECQNQTLGELLPIAGTPFALAYRSDRVPGYVNLRALTIPLTRATVPASLKRVDLDVAVAGQKHKFSFPTTPGQSTSFTWDGRDAYGRSLIGRQLLTATVNHVYDGVYYDPPANFQRGFALPPLPDAPVIAIGDREIAFPQTMVFGVEARHASQAPVAGWYVSAHHRYDVRSRVMFMGDGNQRTAAAVGDVVEAAAGGGETPVEAAPVPAREAHLVHAESVAAAGDGSVYLDDGVGIVRLSSGLVTRIATFGEGGLPFNGRLAARGDTVVYAYGDAQGDCFEGGRFETLHVRRLTPNGLGEELAVVPTGGGGFPCGGGAHVAIGTDGSFFLGAGFDAWVVPPGAGPVQIGGLPSVVSAIAAGPAGSLYITVGAGVSQWRPDGSLRVVAGNGMFGHEGDGGPALSAPFGSVRAMVADADGNLLIASSVSFESRIRVVRPNGIIEWYAGNDLGGGSTSDGAAGRAAALGFIRGLALAPDGSVYVSGSDFVGPRFLRLRLPFDGTRVPSSDGASIYEFDLSGRHLRTVDALTGVALLTFTYDTAGRLAGITDRDGLETRILRNGAGAPQSIVNPFGVETALTIGAGGYLQAVTDPEGRTTSLGYREGGLLTLLRDANGGDYTFDYDARGRLLLDADPAGGAQDLSRSESAGGWTVTRDVSDAGTTTYVTQQGANGTQTRRTIAPDGTETVALNRGDGSTVTTSPDGTETTSTLAPDPRFGFTAPVAASTTTRTPAGLTMTVAQSRSVVLSDPDNPLSVVSHTETTTLNGRVSRSVFDAAARTITSISPANRRVVTTLDTAGRPLSVQVGTAMLPTTFTYDASGRLATQTQGARTTTFDYDERGFLGSVTDPLSRTVQFTNDLSGRRLSQTFPDLREATFAYDSNGNLTSLTPPGRPAHVMTYTPANLLESYTAPNVGPPTTSQYQFNLAKQPTTVTRADGQEVSSVYDTAGRPATLTTPTGLITYNYDATTGQLASLTSPSGMLTYSYDGALQTAETASGFSVGSVSWNYDASFRVTNERINGSNAITFGYDTDSLLTNAGALTYTRRVNDGLLLTATLGSSVTTFTYSGFGELATEESRYGAAVLHSGVYTRDNGGRLAERTETIDGTTTIAAYSYDLAGRLTAVTRGGAPLASYNYDANGNRTSVTTGAGTLTATYDDQDRILTFGDRTYTHNVHGEVRSWTDTSGTTTLTYDVQGNLLSVNLPAGATVEYVVDARGRRIGRKVNGAVTHNWLYQGQLRPVAELDASGAIVSRFVYGSRAVAPEYMIRAGVAYRLITDQLGSVRVVVNTGNGAIAQRLDYDAWGQVVTDTNPGFQPFGYAGGLYDESTGLVRFGLRDLDPIIGRWLSKDPVGFGGGDSNLFSYVGNDPINFVDPFGLVKVKVGGEVIVVHRNDVDPFPSVPHGHIYDKGQKVNVHTGEIVKDSMVVGKLSAKHLKVLRSALRKAGLIGVMLAIGVSVAEAASSGCDLEQALGAQAVALAGSAAGGFAGGVFGAKLGGALGMMIAPGPGAVIGAAAGGVFGSIIGAIQGESMAVSINLGTSQ